MGDSESENTERLVREGLNHFGVGEVAEAVRCWENVLRIDPSHPKALDYLQAAGSSGEAPDREPDVGPTQAAAPEAAGTESASAAGRLVEEARARLAAEDLEGALNLFRVAADLEPDRIEVEWYVDAIRSRLLQRYRKRVGETGAVPKLLIQPSEITRHQLPADAGFVLSLVDGETTVEQLIALSGLDAFEALRILNDLFDAGIAGLQS